MGSIPSSMGNKYIQKKTEPRDLRYYTPSGFDIVHQAMRRVLNITYGDILGKDYYYSSSEYNYNEPLHLHNAFNSAITRDVLNHTVETKSLKDVKHIVDILRISDSIYDLICYNTSMPQKYYDPQSLVYIYDSMLSDKHKKLVDKALPMFYNACVKTNDIDVFKHILNDMINKRDASFIEKCINYELNPEAQCPEIPLYPKDYLEYMFDSSRLDPNNYEQFIQYQQKHHIKNGDTSAAQFCTDLLK